MADDDFFPREPNRVVVGIGTYNVTDSDDVQQSTTYRAELRLSQVPVWKLHPWIGFEYTNNDDLDSEAHWIGGGLETDLDLYSDWLVLTLQTGVGYFDDGETPFTGWRYNPDSGIEFRHQAELGIRFMEHYRAALGISHMSNADISDNNDSINSLTFNVHVPLGAAE